MLCKSGHPVEDGGFSQKVDFSDFLEDSKSPRVFILHDWFKSYNDFSERVDFAYWLDFSGGGFAVNGATPSSSSPNMLIELSTSKNVFNNILEQDTTAYLNASKTMHYKISL